jgi:hypothetical protein
MTRIDTLNRWIKANVEGVKQGDPEALVTVGFLQMTRTSTYSTFRSPTAPQRCSPTVPKPARRFNSPTAN